MDKAINSFIIPTSPSINIDNNKILSLVYGIKLLNYNWKLGFCRTFFQSIDDEGTFELKSNYTIHENNNNSQKLYYKMPNSKDKETLEIIKTLMEKPTLLKRMKKFPDKFYQEIKFNEKVRQEQQEFEQSKQDVIELQEKLKEALKDKKSKKKAAKDEKATEGQNKKGKKWSFSNLFKRKPRENRDNDGATFENGYNDVTPPPSYDVPTPPPPDENGVIESLLRYYREILDIQELYYDSLERKSDLENKIAMLEQVINDAPITNAMNLKSFLDLLNEKASHSISANDIDWNLSDDQFRDFVRSVIR